MKKTFPEINCEGCNRRFKPVRWFQRFCSKECRMDKWYEDHPRSGVNRQAQPEKVEHGK